MTTVTTLYTAIGLSNNNALISSIAIPTFELVKIKCIEAFCLIHIPRISVFISKLYLKMPRNTSIWFVICIFRYFKLGLWSSFPFAFAFCVSTLWHAVPQTFQVFFFVSFNDSRRRRVGLRFKGDVDTLLMKEQSIFPITFK